MRLFSYQLRSLILLVLDISLLVIIVLLTVLIAETATTKGIPEVLEIKSDGTTTWYEDPSIKLRENYIPTDAVYIKTIKNFIRGMRMVESFYDNNEELVKTVLLTTTGSAYKQIQEHLKDNNPFDLSKNKKVDVPYNSISVTKISQDQWKASWRERTYDTNGNLTMEADYEAVLHTRLLDVKDTGGELNAKVYNPLGIYIYDYDIDLLKKLK